jgi:predicted amidohydrolase YtcJ
VVSDPRKYTLNRDAVTDIQWKVFMLLTNARVYTLDQHTTSADSVVVRNETIAFVGRRHEINPDAGEETIDLRGRVVLPGFVDSHAHLIGLARGMTSVDVGGFASIDDVARVVAAAARERTSGEWIVGRGWDQSLWLGGDFPSHAPLTTAAPDNPVSLTRIDGHATWVNAVAMRAAGIRKETDDPPGGRLLRDADGQPTGVLIDLAQDLVRTIIPEPGEAETDAAIERAIARCLGVGLVGVHEMGIGLETVDAYKRLIARGRFPFRNYAAVMGRSRSAWPAYRERGPESDPSGRLTIRAVKFLADGALGSRGAAMHEPYSDDPDNTGLTLIEPAELEHLTGDAAAAGFQPCIHAIGDRANTAVLDAFATVLARYPGEDRRFRIEHAQILRHKDIPRFHRLGVLPSMQPAHCTSDMRWAGDAIGSERLSGAYAWRSLLDSGVKILGGSDFPVEPPDPLFGIHAAVTRRPREGDDPHWQPQQRMTRLEAIRSFTTWAAYGAFEEQIAGSIEPGKRADLVVLDDDPFTCDEQRIATIPVVMTLVGGEIAYQMLPTKR